ncbi:polysaccharide biosynthesis protein [Jannaschia pohangensis]|uniref:NDP-sugar epimerase, includes UDP-GlcNAc-inverting 4,6-dehydratase FlaA1 and capsular polysaccharide biosynthesis protein EpsC n=1 Tax=Jannaschia pohangensis TaxID=390807 RepID=A0A1I3TSE7_9RHOB|nr:nucleoside-diphosphate sugar epimerase/dehydratase [Jannaschia pohangensis]SFJ74188.1 NDP-sugar epimerase, includes UDP-GlcNAc-inverting 4,6-dehydratase FlaA1 and capsular polysaccharide biosynthesis protein EpsC [Jannaschia pohangensis]
MRIFKQPDSVLKGLSRRKKYAFFLLMDTLFIPFALATTLMMAPLPWNAPSAGMILLVAGPALALIGALLLVAMRIPAIQLVEFDGDAILRIGVIAAVLATVGTALAVGVGVELPRSAFFVFAMVLWLSIAVSRVIMLQVVLAIYRRSNTAIRVLIYGAGSTGTQLVQAFRSHHDIDPVAFVDDNPALQGLTIAGLPVHTPIRIAEIARDKRIDRVLLAVPSLSPPKQARIARRLQRLGLEVQSLPSFSQLIGTEALIDRLETLKPKMFLNRDEVKAPLLEGADSYTGKSVMVSGAGGSIGSELCRQLLECRPRRLVLFELSEIALFTVHQELRGTAAELHVELIPVLGSVTDGRQVRQVLAQHVVEVVLHAAAYKHVALVQQNPLAGIANNVLGTHTLATAVVEAGVERFILISSDKAVRPRGVMGATKRLAELVVQDIAQRTPEGGTVLSMVRFGNVLGSSGSVVPIFHDQIRRGGPVTVTHPHVTRYFMTIEEAARLVLRAGSMAEGGEVFLLDMGNPVKILDLAIQSIEAAGYTVRSEDNAQGDISIRFTGLQPGEKLHEELFFDGSELPTTHTKIFRVREPALSEFVIARMLRNLRQALASGDGSAAIDIMAEQVEGFRGDQKTVPPIEPGRML